MPKHSFPSVRWKHDTATFVATHALPDDPAVPAPAALVFPFYGDKVVLADIATRGWCIPSGHVEPGESFEEAVRREAFEEAGATLDRVAFIGYFVLTRRDTGAVRHAPTFIGEVQGLAAVPPGTESRGMQMVNVEDVAGLYFAWDDLLAAVFTYAYEEKQARFPVGLRVSALTAGGNGPL
jgi:8-oxo-dGTP diphosphatase